MAVKQQIRDLAKRLVELSLKNGEVSVDKVRETLQYLAANPPRKYKALLRLYQRGIEKEISNYTARVEHAGPISESAITVIRESLENAYGRSIQMETNENPGLIAGLRVSLGDDVYEDSAEFRLTPLAENVL